MDFSKPIDDLVELHYLKLLNGNFVTFKDRDLSEFVNSVRKALDEIEPNQVERLLRIAWREQLTAAWFAGLKNWPQFTNRIGDLLIQSLTCYAGQGYCFALACFANADSINYLTRYLDEYLPQPDKDYDQPWAMAALIWIDIVNGGDHSGKYLGPNGLWEHFIAGTVTNGAWSLEQHNRHFENMMSFRNKWFGDLSSPGHQS